MAYGRRSSGSRRRGGDRRRSFVPRVLSRKQGGKRIKRYGVSRGGVRM